MRKEVEKFIGYLKDKNNKMANQIFREAYSHGLDISSVKENVIFMEKKMMTLVNLIRMLETEKEDWPLLSEVFVDFDFLSEYLVASPLNTREQMNIIMYFFEKNIATGILEDDVKAFDCYKINGHKFENISEEEMSDFVKETGFKKLITAEDDELSEKERLLKKEILDFTELTQMEIGNVTHHNRVINDCYLTKKDTYTKEDIEKVIDVLTTLKINDELCKGIRYLLEKDLEKRNSRNQKITLKKEEPKKRRLTSKEYNVVFKEVRQYFDIVRMIPVRPLSLDESIYLTHLLIKMNVEKSQIDLILNMVEMENKRNSCNPIAIYCEIYNKLKYYEEEIGSEKLKVLNDYMNELFICSNSDYLFWKENLKNDLNDLIRKLPKGHQFELEESESVKTK